MAIAKDIAIHSKSGIKNCSRYIKNKEKTELKNDIKDTLDYATNPNKTSLTAFDNDKNLLITGIDCEHFLADLEFTYDKDLYYHKNKMKNLGTKINKETGEVVSKEEVDAYHIVQSFPPDVTLDPRLCHKLGIEFAKKTFPNHRSVVATHMNTDCIHNHILVNAYNIEGSGKIPMNMEFRRKYRQINDEISLEYGLPILIGNSIESSQEMEDYREFYARNRGDSWKQSLKNDLKECSKISSDWEDFLDNVISNGYSVSEKEGYVTYTIKDAVKPKRGRNTSRSVRDKTLGNEFTKESIIKAIENNNGIIKEDLSKKRKNKINKDQREFIKNKTKKKIYVSRFSNTGRERSELEMIIIKAIRSIKTFMNKHWNKEMSEKFKSSPTWYNAETKLRVMEESLLAIKTYGLENGNELVNKMNQVGAELSHLKREEKDLKSIETSVYNTLDLVDKFKSLEKTFPFLKDYNKEDLLINPVSEKEIIRHRASKEPMTAKQKRELFTLLQENDNYGLLVNFKDLSYTDAKSTIKFLNGKSTNKPPFILDKTNEIEALQIKYSRVLEKDRETNVNKFRGKPISNMVSKKIESILKEKEINIDVSSLDMEKSIEIINCYGNFPTLEYVTGDEKGIRDSIAEQIYELGKLKNVDLEGLSIEKLTEKSGFELRSYLLYKDETPNIEKELNYISKEKFIASLQSYNIDQADALCQYRDLYKELLDIGINEHNIEKTESTLEKIIDDAKEIKNKISDLTTDYKNLRNLSYNLSLAENKAFCCGPLYKEEGIEYVIENRSEEKDISNKEEIEYKKENKDKKDIFISVNDMWYDRF